MVVGDGPWYDLLWQGPAPVDGARPGTESCLVISEKRSSLPVSWRRRGLLSPAVVSASGGRDRDDNGGHEQDSHDGEGEDPLERDNLSEELGDTNGGCQNAQVEAHGIVLSINR